MSPGRRRGTWENTPEELNLVTLHLGNGASMAAVREGKCVDTSMGLTPLAGLVMGTRSGDVDPALPFFLADHLDMSLREIDGPPEQGERPQGAVRHERHAGDTGEERRR